MTADRRHAIGLPAGSAASFAHVDLLILPVRPCPVRRTGAGALAAAGAHGRLVAGRGAVRGGSPTTGSDDRHRPGRA
jgi:hypothetical protein